MDAPFHESVYRRNFDGVEEKSQGGIDEFEPSIPPPLSSDLLGLVTTAPPGEEHIEGNPNYEQNILELDDIVATPWQYLDTADISIDEFFRNNGAWRPPEPCTYCSRLRLQCFMLQTTSANPNPINSCSSCVALFRQCSLAERGKRLPAEFETFEPVINNLHGVNEEPVTSSSLSMKNVTSEQSRSTRSQAAPSKRFHSRSVRRTQLLRSWFACHLDYPYPSEEEKVSLAQQSGLSRTQIADWFPNARRRHRMSAAAKASSKVNFPQGSPMPTSASMLNMTPFERWRQSPPDEEPISESVIQQALDSSLGGVSGFQEIEALHTDAGISSGSGGSTFNVYALWQYPSSDSTSSAHTYSSTDDISIFSTSAGSLEGLNRSKDLAKKNRRFQCTFCSRSFARKYDWRRHEKSVHDSNEKAVQWTCAIPLPSGQPSLIWRLNQREPECIFCGHISPTEEHFQSHEFEACAERAVPDRTFARKDHLWQHLYKFHGCRKWDGWKPDLNLLRHDSGD
ncbi:uncharacterized protein F4822DRAFT_426663 [Hypoxylon trugodes]|uniref:uncharacterized protein n=1 Tax=Hypoxylon trugodes TaxID=326681 RepID=UPI0021A0BAD9|nr:uncharacterized protein F4822DRAFT_426663 [Hypoxylon trugodes]KAI1390816.1 hypothetical protein F4822DRAFT_426663 [Hypoxylon trugodes]